MLTREIATGASHASHHFIRDEQNAMAPADVSDGLRIARRWDDGAERRPAHRFEDKCRGLAIRGIDRFFQIVSILLAAIAAAVRAVVGAAIAIWKRHVGELAHHRQVHFATATVARHGQCAERRSVITLCPADYLIPLRLADLYLILSRQLKRRFDRLGATAGEVNTSAQEVGSSKPQKFV